MTPWPRWAALRSLSVTVSDCVRTHQTATTQALVRPDRVADFPVCMIGIWEAASPARSIPKQSSLYVSSCRPPSCRLGFHRCEDDDCMSFPLAVLSGAARVTFFFYKKDLLENYKTFVYCIPLKTNTFQHLMSIVAKVFSLERAIFSP